MAIDLEEVTKLYNYGNRMYEKGQIEGMRRICSVFALSEKTLEETLLGLTKEIDKLEIVMREENND